MRFNVPGGPESFELIDRDDRIVTLFKRKQPWEVEVLKAWDRIIRGAPPASMVIDAGAYTGFYSCATLAVRPDLTVFAFEPDEANFERLKQNVARSKSFGGIHLHKKALWSKQTMLKFYRSKNFKNLTSCGTCLNPKKTKLIASNIESTTLDLMIPTRKDSTISAIKIDVERAELHVIRGASQIIKKHRPAIIAEHLSQQALSETLETLEGFVQGWSTETLDARNTLFINSA